MKYENRTVPEGINVTDEHPLKEFFILVAGVFFIVAAVVISLALLAQEMVVFIPFEKEIAIAGMVDDKLSSLSNEEKTPQQVQIETYLQKLAEDLASYQDLPEGMTITVHYSEEDVVNAFATLGGHITMYQGLVSRLESENALAMVMAHEIAHIKYRHPIVSLGRGVTIGLALASIAGVSNNGIAESIIGTTGTVTALSFNRQQEKDADATALKSVYDYYGHIDGAVDLYIVLAEANDGEEPFELLSTHPLTDNRIEAIEQITYELDLYAEHAALTPLPDFMRALGQGVDQGDDTPDEEADVNVKDDKIIQ